MPAPKMSEKHKLAAYLLNDELGYSQKNIGTLMKVSQGCVSLAVKDARHMVHENKLKKELAEGRQELAAQGYKNQEPELLLPPAKED